MGSAPASQLLPYRSPGIWSAWAHRPWTPSRHQRKEQALILNLDIYTSERCHIEYSTVLASVRFSIELFPVFVVESQNSKAVQVDQVDYIFQGDVFVVIEDINTRIVHHNWEVVAIKFWQNFFDVLFPTLFEQVSDNVFYCHVGVLSSDVFLCEFQFWLGSG